MLTNFLTIARLEQDRDWRARIREQVLDLYSKDLRTRCSAPAQISLAPDALLWVEEVFWSRACQEGLETALEGSLVAETLEKFAQKQNLAEMMLHVELMRPLAAEVQALAQLAAEHPDAPPCFAVEQALGEASRHLALAIGCLRAVSGRAQPTIYPADPFVLIHTAPDPLSEWNREQALVRIAWSGRSVVSDSWGRAQAGSLVKSARRARTMGGKIDQDLLAGTNSDGRVPLVQASSGEINTQLRSRMALMTASELAEEFILANPLVCRSYAGAGGGDGKGWSPKSRQQFRSAAQLATKFAGLKPFVQLTHGDYVAFYKKLLALPTDHHIPLGDDARSLDEIIARAEAAAKDGAFKALGLATARRHANNVRILYTWLSTMFVMPLVMWDRVITWRGRETRGEEGLTLEQVEEIFRLPVWTGALSYRGTPRKGSTVWHSAFYWVPLCLWYTGIARDALCASEAGDIHQVGDLWCLRVRMDREGLNKERGFDRDVPLHPELIRLGFIEYARAIEAEGHRRLFPELQRASGQSPADIFSSRCWRPIRAALPWLPLNCAVGAIRDAAEQALKDAEVFEEKMLDLFGNRGSSEADLRYTRITPPSHLMEIVNAIPNITQDIPAHPIRLLPADAMAPSPARIISRVQERLHQDEHLSRVVSPVAANSNLPRLPRDAA